MNSLDQQLISFPTPFVRALTKDKYSKGESQFSVTQLISPPMRTWLATFNEKTETPYSSFAALLGTAIHHIIEDNTDESAGEIAERRMFAEICGSMISGQLDLWEKETLYDYKSTRGVQEQMKPDHYLQVNMNAYLAGLNGIKTTNVAVVYIQMDWSYMQSQVNFNYPKSPYKIFIHPYDEKVAIETFNKTIPEHLAAIAGKPRECTREEKWQKDDSYALMKPDAKRASKVCGSLAEAEAEKKPGQIIQVRKGERTFCDMFCGFKHVCPQFKRESMEIANQNNEP